MVNRVGSTTMVLIGAVALVLTASNPGQGLAAEKDKSAKKPKAAPEAKTSKPKTDKPKFQSAETAGKAKACFGTAPNIERLVPDEGKPGDKVTIKGSMFGSPDCLRGVSFGPGHAATFAMQNDSTITATVPTGGRKGLAIVTVTTASGEDSKPFLVK
jgi:IPT/TIG domain-containing protein